MDISEPIYLQIQITDNQAETIEIQPEDDLEEVIDSFCYQYNLDEDQKKAIFETILAYLENVSYSQSQPKAPEPQLRAHKRSDSYTSSLYSSQPQIPHHSRQSSGKFPLKNENPARNQMAYQTQEAYNPNYGGKQNRDNLGNRKVAGNSKNRFYEKLKQESQKTLGFQGQGHVNQSNYTDSIRESEENYQMPIQMQKYSSKRFPPANLSETDEGIRKQLAEINKKIIQENTELENHFDLDISRHVKASDPGHNDQDIDTLNENLEQRLMGNVN